MLNKNGQAILGVVASLLFLAFALLFGISEQPLQLFLVVFVLAPIVFLITFINTDAALILLIFSMLLSPELKLAEVPQRAVVVRVDDILLFVVFFTWLAKMAINKQLGLLKHTPLNAPIGAFILVCLVSTAIGILAGRIHPIKSFFYLLKFIEYYLLFFMVSNNIRSKEQVKTFMIAFLITCTYALVTVGPMGRVTAPFEGPKGEPNTLGEYLVILFAVCAGFFLYHPSHTWRFLCAGLACYIFVTLIHTLSRSSYIAFIPMYLSLIFFTRKKKVLLIGALILGVLILPARMPQKVVERIERTFVPGRVYKPIEGTRVALDEAAAARVETWKWVIPRWLRRPLLGYGVSGLGLIDTQYARVLAETGIIGLWIFLWLMLRIFRGSVYVFIRLLKTTVSAD